MVSSRATTVAAYLQELPAERRAVVSEVRKLIRDNLPDGYTETMNWGIMGKSCLHFKKLDDLPFDVIGQVVRNTSVEDYIRRYEKSRKR